MATKNKRRSKACSHVLKGDLPVEKFRSVIYENHLQLLDLLLLIHLNSFHPFVELEGNKNRIQLLYIKACKCRFIGPLWSFLGYEKKKSKYLLPLYRTTRTIFKTTVKSERSQRVGKHRILAGINRLSLTLEKFQFRVKIPLIVPSYVPSI